MKQLLKSTLLALIATAIVAASVQAVTYGELKPNQAIAQFRTECIYENDARTAIGARFRHNRSGYIVDVFTIQTAPQAFMWFNTPPPSDQGEPHTCEHLLLGKGTKGRYVASLEDMLLGESSAFTMQLQTCYHFNVASGTDNFFQIFEAKLDALIHPNYSDEEIRREVCHVGLTVDQATGQIGLEEKGTVYNEMLRGFESPWGELMLTLGRLQFGENHPLSLDAGGYPPAIRTMTPADLRRFQEGSYLINNGGVVIAIPDDVTIEDCLSRLSGTLDRVQPELKMVEDPADFDLRIAPGDAAPAGETKIVNFPAQSETDPGLLVFGWPARNFESNNERYLLELLIDNFAGDQTAIMHKRLIDSQTRTIDVGATGVGAWISGDWGHPIYLYFDDIRREACAPLMIDSLRRVVMREFQTIAAWPDGSTELLAFNEKALDRIRERERSARTVLNSPPRFGERGSGATWMTNVMRLHKSGGFRRSLTFADETSFAREQLSNGKNPWRDIIGKWRLTETPPYAVASVAGTDLIAKTEAERKARIEGYLAGIKKQFNVASDEQALQAFKTDYDKKTAEIDAAAATIIMPNFVENPPMTLDDPLRYSEEKINGAVPLVASTFENITSATTGLAFRCDVIPEADLMYLSVVPNLISDIGVMTDSGAIGYDVMTRKVRQEIQSLSAYFNVNYRTGRSELVLRAAGSESAEALRSLDWLDKVLFDAYLAEENLPRIRDVVDQTLGSLRSTMRGSEESWVENPADAYWRQDNPLLLATGSFLTRQFHIQRLKWMLCDAGDPNQPNSFRKFLEDLAARGGGKNRAELSDLLATLSGEKKDTWPSAIVAGLTARYLVADSRNAELIKMAAEDLQRLLPDIPDATLASDWQYLCWQMASDIGATPQVTLAKIRSVIETLRHTDNVRAFMISSTANRTAMMPKLSGIIGKLNPAPSKRQTFSKNNAVINSLKSRAPEATTPLYVGLVNENTRSGVHVITADCASFTNFKPETLVDFIAARLYGGGGAHSMFMKTWGAGLAYSNGLRSRESTGRIVYYAERCPDLAQTMQFVVGELKKAPHDPALGDYAVAQTFNANRAASGYEARGEAMARDLADGITPETVRSFRQGILELHQQAGFYDRIQSRMEYVYGLLLPDYGPSTADAVAKANANNFAIGPEKQLESWERYVSSVEKGAKVFRLYPSDFWIHPQP